ncbi:MAG TPA: HAMP domain-containing sensor histidine kinase [Bdellovibrionales bacterium]|nr:HAMP domain-containing sensor histidine kinase [Bdellovibrionales bacterium]
MKDRTDIFAVVAHEAIMGVAVFHRIGGECLYTNRIAREFLELPAGDGDENPALHMSEIMTLGDRPGFARAFRPEMIEHEGFYQEVLLRKKNGHGMVSNVGIKHAVIENGVPVVLVMFQDITIQKKLQREVLAKQEEINKAYAELLEHNKQLKALDLAKDRFVALTTHELRTPLAAIVSTAEVLNLKLYDTEEEKFEFIRTIHEQSLHLMELVNDILDFAKIRAGKMDFYVEHVNLVPLVDRLLSNFQNMADQSQVTLEFKKPSEEMLAWTDILRMKEIVNNVLNNAIKYNRKGGSVVVSMEKLGTMIRVCVADTGPGISPENIKNVFNEFETVGQVAKHHKGTGLGMPISKQLIEKMGGSLTLESVVGQGTVFFIDVPIEKVLPEEMYNTRPDAWADLAA